MTSVQRQEEKLLTIGASVLDLDHTIVNMELDPCDRDKQTLKSPSKSVIKEVVRHNAIRKFRRHSEDYIPQKISNQRRMTCSELEENRRYNLRSDNKTSRKYYNLRQSVRAKLPDPPLDPPQLQEHTIIHKSTISSTSDSSSNQQHDNPAVPLNDVTQSTNENLKTWQECMADFLFAVLEKHKEYLKKWLKSTKIDQFSWNVETFITNPANDFSWKIYGQKMVKLLKKFKINGFVEPEKTIEFVYNHLILKENYSLPQFYIYLDSLMSYNKDFYENHSYLRNFYETVHSRANQMELKTNKEQQSTQPKYVLTNQQLATLNRQINFCNMIINGFENQNREMHIQSTPRRYFIPIQPSSHYPSRNLFGNLPTAMPFNIPQMIPFTQNLPDACPMQPCSSNIYQQQQVINQRIPQRASIIDQIQQYPTASQSIFKIPSNHITPINELPSDPLLISESPTNEYIINWSPINSPINETTSNHSIDESTISSSLINQSSVNKSLNKTSTNNESTINSSLINQSSVNKSLNKTSTNNESTINSSPIHQSDVNESHINESSDEIIDLTWMSDTNLDEKLKQEVILNEFWWNAN